MELSKQVAALQAAQSAGVEPEVVQKLRDQLTAERIKNAQLQADSGERFVDPEKHEALLISEATLRTANEYLKQRLAEQEEARNEVAERAKILGQRVEGLCEDRAKQAAEREAELEGAYAILDRIEGKLSRCTKSLDQLLADARAIDGELRRAVSDCPTERDEERPRPM